MIVIEGLTVDQHRELYPERWTRKARAWPVLWWGLVIIPVVAGLNWLEGAGWSHYDSGACIAWITRSLFIALSPDQVKVTATYYLDRVPWWRRISGKARKH